LIFESTFSQKFAISISAPSSLNCPHNVFYIMFIVYMTDNTFIRQLFTSSWWQFTRTICLCYDVAVPFHARIMYTYPEEIVFTLHYNIIIRSANLVSLIIPTYSRNTSHYELHSNMCVLMSRLAKHLSIFPHLIGVLLYFNFKASYEQGRYVTCYNVTCY